MTRDVHDHVGFGQGVHMCMGMHLARREIIPLLEALRRRVERFELLGEPVIAMNNTIRGYAQMSVKVHLAKEVLEDSTRRLAKEELWLGVVVSLREDAATDVVSLELSAVVDTPLEVNTDGAPFTVIAKQSGIQFDVEPGETISEMLSAKGIEVPMSCQSGVCGTCLTRVVEGTPDHRDFLQTDLEKASNQNITVCCSRSKSKILVLDL